MGCRARPGRDASPCPSRRPAHHAVGTSPQAFDNAKLHRNPNRQNTLPDRFQAEFMEAAKGDQLRTDESIVGYVEVFRIGNARTPIFGGP